MTTDLAGASVWEQELYEHLTKHEASERGLLDAYREAVEESKSPALAYVCKLIIDDEIRHHRMFQDLASSLRTDAELSLEQPAIPRLTQLGANRQSVEQAAERLLDQERSDASDLRRLRRELRDVKDTTLWSLLVHVMELDTEKHIAMLDFVRRHTRQGVG